MVSKIEQVALAERNATVVFADVAESTSRIEAGGRRAVEVWCHAVNEVARSVEDEYGGRVVERQGDGFLLEFDNAKQATACAFALHRKLFDISAADEASKLMFRIGIHRADVFADDHALYGHGVNIAARALARARPGETIVTSSVRDALTADLDATIDDLGDCFLKNISAPVRLFRISEVTVGAFAPDYSRQNVDGKPCVAVVPPAALQGAIDETVLAQVLADDLTAGLARSSHVKVISSLSAQAFRSRAIGVASIGKQLGADYLVTGTVHVDGTRARVYLELARVIDETVVWCDRVPVDTTVGWLCDASLAHEMASRIVSNIVDSEIDVVRFHALPQVKDYSLLLGAIGLMFRTQRADFERSREALEHLIERYPTRPQPRAWLAKWHVFRVTQGWFTNIKDETNRALDLVHRALDLQADEPTALTVRGLIKTNLRKEAAEGLRDYDAALASNPNSALTWLYRGTALAFSAGGKEALANAETALSLSPFDPWKHYFLALAATAALAAEDWSRAEEFARASLRLNALHQTTQRALAIALAMSGQHDEAKTVVARIRTTDETWTVATFLARSPSGQTARGARWAEALATCGLPTH